MRVLLANEPRLYREVLAETFQRLRPQLEACAVEPQELNQEVLRVRPDLVICDRVTPVVEVTVRFWIEYREENEALVVTATNVWGLALHTDGMGLNDLLSVIDRTEELLAHTNHTDARMRDGPK
jgi:hypothetical protein